MPCRTHVIRSQPACGFLTSKERATYAGIRRGRNQEDGAGSFPVDTVAYGFAVVAVVVALGPIADGPSIRRISLRTGSSKKR